MKYSRLCRFLSLGIILALLVSVLAIPAHAAGGVIVLNPFSGRVGDWIEISGSVFDANRLVFLWFSSDEAEVDDALDDEVNAYEYAASDTTDTDGDFAPSMFFMPYELTQGSVKEDVHDGDYYFYATYANNKTIVAVAGFTVIDGEIELDPAEGAVGTEVRISGEGLRQNQEIIVEYDGDEVDITSGDNETDRQGKFAGTIIIPESTFGSHTVTVTDESGNTPEAEFSVQPKIALDPPNQVVGGVVTVNGAGFAKREAIALTLDGQEISTTPPSIITDHLGSFSCSFVVPLFDSWGIRRIGASDRENWISAEAQLTVSTSVTLSPITSLDSPGYVGLKLFVCGTGFIANGTVTVTYAINDEVIPVATAAANSRGNLAVEFTVPASVAGSHVVTVTDGTTSVNAVFTMESQAPPAPHLLEPDVASTSPAEAYFDWEDVIDPSGASYILQVAADVNFTTIVLERTGLSSSEYAVREEEKLAPAEAVVSYYWRVKAVDGASNEGDWSLPRLFYVTFSGTSLLGWVWYTICGLGILLLVIAGLWWWRRRAE